MLLTQYRRLSSFVSNAESHAPNNSFIRYISGVSCTGGFACSMFCASSSYSLVTCGPVQLHTTLAPYACTHVNIASNLVVLVNLLQEALSAHVVADAGQLDRERVRTVARP